MHKEQTNWILLRQLDVNGRDVQSTPALCSVKACSLDLLPWSTANGEQTKPNSCKTSILSALLGHAPETSPFLYQRGRMQPRFQGSSQPEHAKRHSQGDWEESKALLREQAKHWEKEEKREGPMLRLLLASQGRKQHHLKKRKKKGKRENYLSTIRSRCLFFCLS